jgi:hypothetical protein
MAVMVVAITHTVDMVVGAALLTVAVSNIKPVTSRETQTA